MKPAALTLGSITIAIVCGTGGYFLGRNHSVATEIHGASAPDRSSGLPSNARRGAGIPKTDFTGMRDQLDREQDPLVRINLALKNLEAWMSADPEAALAWLKSQHPTGRRAEIIRMALGQYAENDPKGAAEWAIANLTGVEFNNALIRIAEQWARRDGSETASWLAALPAGKERDAAMEGSFFIWASQDPAAAVDFINKFRGPDTLSAILRYAAYAGWAKSDPQKAVAASLESSRVYQDPAQFANTIANWATVDLAASSKWLLDNVRDGEPRTRAVEELAAVFAHQSPEAGLAWIGKLNAGAERDMALNQLASEWAVADAAAAAKWAAGQTLGELTDDSVAQILHTFLAHDAPAFEAWRAALPEGPLKDRAGKVGATDDGE